MLLYFYVAFLEVQGSAEFYDHFGDPTTATYTGGYAMIYCVFFGRASQGKMKLLDPNNKELNSADLVNNAASFRLDITETMVLGRYRCDFNVTRDEALRDEVWIRYRLCMLRTYLSLFINKTTEKIIQVL